MVSDSLPTKSGAAIDALAQHHAQGPPQQQGWSQSTPWLCFSLLLPSFPTASWFPWGDRERWRVPGTCHML